MKIAKSRPGGRPPLIAVVDVRVDRVPATRRPSATRGALVRLARLVLAAGFAAAREGR